MPLFLSFTDIAVRLLLAAGAGLLFGLNREEHGRPAGMRTTLLVCLAAAVAMIQANLLLGMQGKASDSFVVLDLMRLPLGILSGMGFIGAGAIVRKGDLVLGVTTAATLWFVTVVGLCFGGGQWALGLAALVLGIGTLWGLPVLERRMSQDETATLRISTAENGPAEGDVRSRIEQEGCRIVAWGVAYETTARRRQISCRLQWRKPRAVTQPPSFVSLLAAIPGVESLEWLPLAASAEGKSQL